MGADRWLSATWMAIYSFFVHPQTAWQHSRFSKQEPSGFRIMSRSEFCDTLLRV